MRHTEQISLALEIGNSRLHWALFIGETLNSAWDSDYLAESVTQQLAECQTLDHLLLAISPPNQKIRGDWEAREENTSLSPSSPPPLLKASEVPSQTAILQTYPNNHVIT
ncbi:MAG: hypothetical protein ACYTXY_39375 [Nostoc sp.]